MAIEEICALDVPKLATPDAVIFLWAVSSQLPEAFRVLQAWGFEYVNHMVWVKDKIGVGHWVRPQHELMLIGRRGKFPTPLPENRLSSVITAARRERPQKPDETYDLIEKMYPHLPKIELFARNAREGWACWGNQAPALVADTRRRFCVSLTAESFSGTALLNLVQ